MQQTWSFIDRIYCISLTERTDRQAEARSQFEKVGLGERVEFVLVDKHPTDCEQGIFESHLICLRKGIEKGAETILVFEDDVVFDRLSPDLISRCKNFVNNHEQWHMLYLGCMVRASKRTSFPSILQVSYRSLTHAYMVHHRFAEFLISQRYEVPYDDFLKNLDDDQMYGLYPSVAFQSNSRSDNERYLPLDRFRRLLGGLQKLQKRNELYHHHKVSIIAGHVLVIFLLVWVIL